MYFLLVIKKEKKPIKIKKEREEILCYSKQIIGFKKCLAIKICQDPCERIEVIMRMKNSLIQIFNFVHESIFL